MKRQFLFVVLSLVLLFANAIPATAASQVVVPDNSLPSVSAWITSLDTNRKMLIPAASGKLTSQPGGDWNAVYEIEITPKILTALSSSDEKWDSSRAIKVTIWIQWDGFSSYVSVNKYITRWERYDNSVSVLNAKLSAGCYGEAAVGSKPCNPAKSQSAWVGSPQFGTRYSISPAWAGNYILTGGFLGYQAGNSEALLKRGTTKWWLKICIYKGSCGIDG